MNPTTKRRCTQPTKDGQPCRAWAMRDSDPPTCAIHAGRVTGQGAPLGNRNAVKHAFYAYYDLEDDEIKPPSINAIIHDLVARQQQLSAIIDDHLDDLTIQELVRLFAIHGQNASRLGRLLCHRKALVGDGDDRFQQFIDEWIDDVCEEYGVEL
jgi:hypothetical protein